MASVDAAVLVLVAGGLAVFPTESVYGLGADATSAAAVERLRSSIELVHPGHAWLAKLGGSDATEEPGEEAPTR